MIVNAQSWGELAAARLHKDWLGRVWESTPTSLVLISQTGQVVRLVTEEIGNGPFNVVVAAEQMPSWESLPRDLYTWRVDRQLWFGDDLTVQLPETRPWESTLVWDRDAIGLEAPVLSRHLAWLSDWILARAPEGTMAGLLPELLAAGGPLGKEADQPFLPRQQRLFRWRTARVLGDLLPALAVGNLATAEVAINSLAGLGQGMPPAGDWFVLGIAAGIQLYPEFLTEGSGLNATALVQRLVRSAAERTSLLGGATLKAALEFRWEARWHVLHSALATAEGFPDEQRDRLERVAATWIAEEQIHATSALTGLLLPFLWYQRFLG